MTASTELDPDAAHTAAINAAVIEHRILLSYIDWSHIGELTWRWTT